MYLRSQTAKEYVNVYSLFYKQNRLQRKVSPTVLTTELVLGTFFKLSN